MSAPVKSVVIVGADAPAWLAAAALKKALGATGLEVAVVETASKLSPLDVYPAAPSIVAMHRLLGLDERLLFAACRAVPMTGQRFTDWGGAGTSFALGYDTEVALGGDLPFTQYWAKGQIEGLRVPLDEFSLGVACSKLGRVPAADGGKAHLSAGYGYHLDAQSYSDLAREFALRLGVERAGGYASAVCEGDHVTAIRLDDGSELAADFYVDATGSDARLIDALQSAAFEPWSNELPCDRLLVTSAPRLPQLPSFGQVTAFAAGWIGLFPLQDRTAIMVDYASESSTDEQALEQIAAVAGVQVGADAVVGVVRAGMRREPWIGNCVAMGEAAIALDAIDALQLHIVHASLSHLMTTFPATADAFPEAQAYNQAMRAVGANARDFQAAHYKLNRRSGDPFWDRARDAPVSADLKNKIDLFGARAIVALNDDETFSEAGWAALFVGSGLIPSDYDARIEAVSDEQHIAKVQQRLRDVAEVAQRMPPLDQVMRHGLPSAADLGGR